ncbi:MAG: acetylxylan esterase [Nocardioidaceae bacterium]
MPPEGTNAVPMFDLPLAELEGYRPDRAEPADFDQFWRDTLAEARVHDLDARLTPDGLHLPVFDVADLTFRGFGGQPVHGWLIRPRHIDVPLPCVVQYLGYGDGRGPALDWLSLPAAGAATIVMDTRGQGASARRAGATGDAGGSASPYVDGFLTKGILDPADYYYRRVFIDAVRAIEVAHTLPGIDRDRVVVRGASQGGGIALAAAALADGVSAAVVEVPFLCHFARAVEITDEAPYGELVSYLGTQRDNAASALNTLRYFDGMSMAARAQVPALFSVGLMDQVCPPSTVFAAYNHYAGDKEIDVFRYNEHEGGGVHQAIRQISWLQERWGR